MGTRRPIKTRDARWASRAAAWLAAHGARPNTISILSVLFAVWGGVCVYMSGQLAGAPVPVFLVLGALGLQGRLLCNLFDGMIAVEGGFQTKSGEIFNDFPDRLSDVAVLVLAGYAARPLPYAVVLGWCAAIGAFATAYVRVLAGASGAKQRFLGPMAKQHRMAVMTVSFLVAAILSSRGWHGTVLYVGLGVVVAGTAVTTARRLRAAVTDLERL